MTWKTSFLFSRRDLVNQESRYNAQLEAAAQKVNELKSQINDLERDISNKSGVQERKYATKNRLNLKINKKHDVKDFPLYELRSLSCELRCNLKMMTTPIKTSNHSRLCIYCSHHRHPG